MIIAPRYWNYLFWTFSCLTLFIFVSAQALSSENASARTAVANPDVQARLFIDSMGQEAIGFLADSSLGQEEKERRFRALLDEHFDMKTIGRFTLGSHWRSLTPQQQAEYQKLFEDLIVSIYAQRFADYKGQTFRVAESQPTGETDYIVRSHIVPDAGRQIPVNWHVRYKNGSFRIVDVVIEEVSMAITKRAEFASIIQRGGGNAETLLGHLRERQSG